MAAIRPSWIETIPEEAAEGHLAELYRRALDPATGKVAHILRVHSLHPESLEAHLRLYRTVVHGPSGISRAEREMIGVVVSAANRCHY